MKSLIAAHWTATALALICLAGAILTSGNGWWLMTITLTMASALFLLLRFAASEVIDRWNDPSGGGPRAA